MDTTPFLVDILVNAKFYTDAFIDGGCLCFAAFSSQFVHDRNLPRIEIEPRHLKLAQEDGTQRGKITHITFVDADLDGRQERIYGYVIKDLSHNIILGKPWMEQNDVIYHGKERKLTFGDSAGLEIREKGWLYTDAPSEVQTRIANLRIESPRLMIGSHFATLMKRCRKDKSSIISAVTVHDITKALEYKTKLTLEETREALPDPIKHHAAIFTDDDEGLQALAPHRPTDTQINIETDENGREKEVPHGPLYGMSREELLVLRKTLADLLDKNWIRASSSPGGAPVLFVKKPGGGLRFCVDYRALNAITKKDRYPLPLIKETLRTIAKAKWVSKVDVRAAFHRLRIKEGDEWKTAFRTRFGSYEYLVTPFGLAGAPAAFQRWINKVLSEYLGDFCSAYIDDVLIYTDGDLTDHWEKLNLVLAKLEQAGLKLDLKKSEFAVKRTKYLGFIVELDKGICVDPEKVQAIREWEAPSTVKGVRSFVGFANFYRSFIGNFTDLAAPLLALTRKGAHFVWKKQHQEAFESLKQAFISAPILAMWHEDRITVLEADCSGWAMGGCLSQYGPDNLLYPVAYFSKKLSPAECNYEIHDKELLAIVSCVKEWRSELMGLTDPFTILTDHKNLKYFFSTRQLSERQVRWSHILSQFNFKLQFRAGKNSERPDALSRREQDLPKSGTDERLRERVYRLVKSEWLQSTDARVSHMSCWEGPGKTQVVLNPLNSSEIPEPGEVDPPKGATIFEEEHLQILWDQAILSDREYTQILSAVAKRERSLPAGVTAKVQLSECEMDARGALLFRNRLWIPDLEPLRTALIQKSHDSHLTGHPGRDSTLAIVARSFYWPRMSGMVRQFIRNCDVCGRSHVWRDRKRGLLKPLPIPEQFRKHISMDFITDLPAKIKGDPKYMLVVVDRLGKSLMLEPMKTMDAKACAEHFVKGWWQHHGFPTSITSDRGSNWVGDFWRHLCKLVGVEQRLSTAYHPQSDGGPERANQEIYAYIRAFCTYAQFDWPQLTPAMQLALNNRDIASIGMSSFFMEHGYHVEPIQQQQLDITDEERKALPKPAKLAQRFVERLKEAQDYAAAAMASAQARMEDSANRSRAPADRFEIGDKVWLSLRNIANPQPKKKFSWVNAKYTVLEVPTSHTVRLDVPSHIYPHFHVDLLRRAATDPLPSQVVNDDQPPPMLPETLTSDAEWQIDRILRAENKKVGRGRRRKVLVKWTGYAEPTWEPREEFENTEALQKFIDIWGEEDEVGEPEGARTGRGGVRKTRDSSASAGEDATA
jgi:RNase H-like domain found in reverse transcriptase/Reverse transcriptase (RNA-dependent DNA polymerase)/Integrase zinc binding domain/Integrase core domain